VRVGALGDQALSRGGDGGEVDVVPVGGGRRVEADRAGVESGAQVEPDGVGVAGQERPGDLVQLLGPEGDVEDEVGVDVELAVVIVGGADDLVGRGVAEDGVGPAVVKGLAYSVRNRLSSSAVKAGSVTDIGYLLGLVTVSSAVWRRGG
jgi:hypothetical protein